MALRFLILPYFGEQVKTLHITFCKICGLLYLPISLSRQAQLRMRVKLRVYLVLP